MKQHAKRQRPGFESLENRQLLAGTVLIDDSGGNLVITGDALANHIEIRQTGLAEFTVTGKDGEQIRSPGGIFQMPLTQRDLGDLIGITPVHVNRTLREMDRQNLIKRSDQTISLLAIDRLRRVAGLPARDFVYNPDWIASL